MIDAGYAVPRVVCSDIWTVPNQYRWRTIASTFSAFVEDLGFEKVQAGRVGAGTEVVVTLRS